jgi:serine/threonine-protein kinase
MMYKPGQFVGEFSIEELIDQEPPLETYAALRRRDQHQVVLKALPAFLKSQREHHGRFLREAEIMKRLSHPAVPELLYLAPADGDQFFVLDSYDGESLQARLATSGALSITEVCERLDELLELLEFLHGQGVILRNLSPGHLVFGPGPYEREILRVVDFRTARVDFGDDKGQPLTRLGALLGSPEYQAPELVTGGAFDKRADLYSLGCVAYAMLCGAPPFSGSAAQVVVKHLRDAPAPPRQHRPETPPGLEAWILRALRKPAKERFFDADDAREALRYALASGNLPAALEAAALAAPTRPVPAPRPAPVERRPPNPAAGAGDAGLPRWALLGAVGLAVVLAVVFALR